MPQNAPSSGEAGNGPCRVDGARRQSRASSRDLRAGCGIEVYVGRQAASPWAKRRLTHAEIILPFGSAGCNLRWCSGTGRKVESHAGARQICVIGARCLHAIAWTRAGSAAIVRVSPPVLRLFRTPAIRGIFLYDFSKLAQGDILLWDLAAALHNAAQHPAATPELLARSLGTVLAFQVVRAHGRFGQALGRKNALTPKQLKRVTDFIRNHLDGCLTVNTLARKVHLSPFHFIRKFKSTTGLPPHQYVVRCRLEKVHALLRTGNYRIADAASAAGFCDQSHLDRHFRKHFGILPKTLLRSESEQF